MDQMEWDYRISRAAVLLHCPLRRRSAGQIVIRLICNCILLELKFIYLHVTNCGFGELRTTKRTSTT